MEQERMEHSPCSERTVCPHGRRCWCLHVCGPETDFGAVCMVLTITACPWQHVNRSIHLTSTVYSFCDPGMCPSIYCHQASLCARLSSVYLFIKEGMKKLCWHILFVEQAACVAGLVPEATLSEEMVKTGRTGRNASAALVPMLLCRCLGSRNLWRQMFAVLSNTGCQVQALSCHGERMRKAEHLSKNRIQPLFSTLPPQGSKKRSSSGPYILSLGTEEWMGIGEGGIAWGTVYPLPCICGVLRIQLEHSGGTLKAGNENISRYIKIWPFA